MKINLKNDIIIPAWELIKNDSKIKKLQLVPGVLSIIFLSALLSYQSIYTYTVLSHKKEETLEKILKFIHSGFAGEFLIGFAIFLILYIFLIPIFEGALVRYIAKQDKSHDAEIGGSLSIGMYKFFPLFEYDNLFSEFKFLSIVNFYLFMLRFFEFHYLKTISYVFLVVLLFSIIINVLFSYSKYYITLENKKLFKAIGASTKLALMNLKNTTKLYFLMFILNIRVIFNFILFLIFPILLVAILGILTSQILKTITIISLVSLFVLFVLFLGYVAGVLEALKATIWFYAYKKGKEKLHEIEEEINDEKDED